MTSATNAANTFQAGEGCDRVGAGDWPPDDRYWVGLAVCRAWSSKDRRRIRGSSRITFEAVGVASSFESVGVGLPVVTAQRLRQGPVSVKTVTRINANRSGQASGLDKPGEGGAGVVGCRVVDWAAVFWSVVNVEPEGSDCPDSSMSTVSGRSCCASMIDGSIATFEKSVPVFYPLL